MMKPALVIAGLATCLLSLSAAAEQRWQDTFCIEAQQVLAGTDAVAQLQVHDDWDEFVASKASDNPLTVHQYLSNPSAQGMPRTLSCKMRTAERINAMEAERPNAPVASGDTDCTRVHQRMVERVLSELDGQTLAIAQAQIVYDEDETRYIGPRWIKPWPYNAVSLQGDTLHLQSRALYAPHAWWIPMPDRFKGNYYCHLVAPAYLEAILSGAVTPST